MKRLGSALLGLVLLLVGCSGGGGGGSGGGGTGTLSISATDDPFAHELVTEARIAVSKISIHDDSDANGGFLTLYDGAPIDFDLLDLQNGVVHQLVTASLPAGDYRQLRLYVSDASLTLVNGNVYDTASGNLTLTSQASSGFKVFIEPPVHVSSGLTTSLLLDFDLSKTFHPIPANDPLAASSYKLMPVIRTTNLTTTGELRGLVTRDDGSGNQIPVEGATVFVLLPGELDPNNAVATSGTLADGRYAVLGLEPGTYDVLAQKAGLAGRVNGKTVAVGNVTVADVVLQ